MIYDTVIIYYIIIRSEGKPRSTYSSTSQSTIITTISSGIVPFGDL